MPWSPAANLASGAFSLADKIAMHFGSAAFTGLQKFKLPAQYLTLVSELKIDHMTRFDSLHSTSNSYRIPWHLALSYVLLFMLLDWVSYIRPLQGLNITPWSPQPALAIAMLLWNRRTLWLVWVGLLFAEFVVRGTPTYWFFVLTSTGALSIVYAAIAQALRTRLDLRLVFASQKDFLLFTAIVITGALLSSVIYLASLSIGGLGLKSSIYEALARYWVGDAVGLIVLLPMLLVLMDPIRQPALAESIKNAQWWGIAILTCVLLWMVFVLGGLNHFRYFYILFFPVVWLSAKLGVSGAVLSSVLVQIGLIFAIQFVPNEDLAVFELQVLMAAITMTGLLLGVTVDERTRAEANLRSSLRLAAAGQMAASLAHELSQPLTALSNYAQACQMLITDTSGLQPQHRLQLLDVTQRMIDDASRAGLVVKNLRDFFRTGSANLHQVAPESILIEAMKENLGRAEALNIRLENQIAGNLPVVWMDTVQIAVVMRNLITNAIESASASGDGGLVVIQAGINERDLEIEVRDSGPGIGAEKLQTLFEAGPSDKPGGMGVGLSICRAIVEAHGGRLWAEAGAGGCLCFTLPIESGNQSEVQNA